jgi:uncharacterized repeat protein (TIGR01451 family)
VERIKMGVRFALAAGLLGTLVAGTGCESGRSATTANREVMRSYYGVWPDSGMRVAKAQPAPAPAAKPAPAPAPAPRPAPAPAPAVSGDALFLPTGDRATSALSIQCMMPREVLANQNFTYDLVVTNLTRTNLSNVNVTYTLEGARIVSSDPAASGNSFNVGDLAAGASRTIKVTASASGAGSVRGCSSATWSQALCCGTNVVNPALQITKAVSPTGDITACDSVTYTITVTNSGTGSASNVKVTDQLPDGITTMDGRNAVSFDAGTLAAGQNRQFTFQAKPGRTGTFTNNAQATADNGLTARSNDVATTVRKPVLAITKTCPGTTRIGRPATFKITVTNTGDAPSANTVVEDPIPAGATFASASDGGTLQGGRVVWNLGTLAPRTSKELTVTMNMAAVGAINNVATARGTCADPVSANCSTAFQGVADIGTLVTDGDGVVAVGANHTYTCEVKNQGQIPLTGVKMVVTLPNGLSFVSSAANPASAGNKLTFDIGTLPPGATRQFTFTAKSSVAGELLIVGETTCNELKTPIRDDELTNFVD